MIATLKTVMRSIWNTGLNFQEISDFFNEIRIENPKNPAIQNHTDPSLNWTPEAVKDFLQPKGRPSFFYIDSNLFIRQLRQLELRYEDITKILLKLGIPNPRTGRKEWNSTSICRVMKRQHKTQSETA